MSQGVDEAVSPAEVSAPRSAGLVEILLVGGLTPLLFPLAWLVRRALGLDGPELAIGFLTFHAAFVINDPHFAVTYLLFYEDVRERALGAAFPRGLRVRYWLAGFVAPLLLLVTLGFALARGSAWTLGALFSTMFLLVGFHYVKQGFGVLVVLAARRGVLFTARERGALLGHALAGWAYAWASPADPGTRVEEQGVIFTTIPRSPGLERLTLLVLLASVAPLVITIAPKLWRERRSGLLGPLGAYLASIWALSIYASADPLVRYVVPAAHSVQYLYMVWLLKSAQAREREQPPYLEQSARGRLARWALGSLGLGFLLFHGLPTILDGMLVSKRTAASELGPTPYLAAFVVFVNLHHYFMDMVVWRRENPLTRYLRGS